MWLSPLLPINIILISFVWKRGLYMCVQSAYVYMHAGTYALQRHGDGTGYAL